MGFGRRGIGLICFRAIENRDQRRASFRPAAGLDLSRLSEFERHRGCGSEARGGEPQRHRHETAPRPGTHPLQRFFNCSSPKPLPSRVFFLKKKTHRTALVWASELKNRCEGGRTHSPGAALPSLVWLLLSLGALSYIFGKVLKNFCSFMTKDLED
jgi:hypothetical protein